MIPELGHFSLILALVLSIVQSLAPLVGVRSGRLRLMAVGAPAAQAQFIFVAAAFAALSWAFYVNDFSVKYVAMHSHVDTPVAYRLTGVWGSHEGSLLLWALLLSGWSAMAALRLRSLPPHFSARVMGLLGLVSAGFLLFTLITSNPFERLLPAAESGRDLNPLLQDPGMIIHPPLLYMGYVGYAVTWAMVLAGLASGRMDAAWARWCRPWALAAWVFMTLGITVGSAWAYYELGWGGWWFWDPVENASFMPWLVGTALIHSLAVSEKRGAFRHWTVLLAIAAFTLSLLGTFLVRSGVLSSVHAFATDPKRGVFILMLLGFAVIGSLAAYAARAGSIEAGGRFALVSRETSLLGNNLMLVVMSGAVLLGTLYPLAIDALGLGKLSVGAPYFEAIFVPLATPLALLMAVSPLLRWKQHPVAPLMRVLGLAFGASLLAGVALAAVLGHFTPLRALGWMLVSAIVVGSMLVLWQQSGRSVAGVLKIKPAFWGMWLAHIGIAMFIAGVTGVKSYEVEQDVRISAGESVSVAGYDFKLESLTPMRGPNYGFVRGEFTVTRQGELVAKLSPEKRMYFAQQMPTSEAAIDAGFLRHIYVALGERAGQDLDGAWIVRLYVKPLVGWIWFGCLLMALGGTISALDRRYRRLVSEPAKAIRSKEVAA